MVFFTCYHCGESVKKPAVSKHYLTKCRNKDPFLTCVDCLKDFKGNDYEAHTKCMTEDERYSAKGYVPKPSQNKGERKQQAWHECIQTVLKKTTLKQDERDLIKAISKYENVPRKKEKFVNFLSNAFKQYANKNDLINRVWTEMESVLKELSANQKEAQKQQKEGSQPQPQNDSKKVSQEAGNPEVKNEEKRKRKAEEAKVIEASGSDKVNDKSKKKKAEHSDKNVIEGNTDMLPANKTEDQAGKNSRKRKADDGDKVEQNDSVADEAESAKKKKKHDKPAENQTIQTSKQGSQDVSKSKKNKKKSKGAEAEAKPNEKEKVVVAAAEAEAKPNEKEKMVVAAGETKPKKIKKKSDNKENSMEKPAEPNVEGGAETEKAVPKEKKSTGGSDVDKPGAFDWKAAILQVLNQDGKNNKIQLQKLQKKVLELNCQALNCENSVKRKKKFMKKLKEMPQIEIEEGFVVLKS